jgi:hypothetical protein
MPRARKQRIGARPMLSICSREARTSPSGGVREFQGPRRGRLAPNFVNDRCAAKTVESQMQRDRPLPPQP